MSNMTKETYYVGNRCVWCGEDTAWGFGRFINRIPVESDITSTRYANDLTLTERYDTVVGYGCQRCYEGEDND